MKTDWTKISRNPTSQEALSHLAQELKNKKAGRTFDQHQFLKNFVQDRSVLDIGVVEHDITHIQSKDWKHKYIKEWARSVLGVDILEQEVSLLRQMGYNVVCADATSNVDLGQRFERVAIGDVIEHVNNAVDLLKFAARHLEEDGQVLVTTPNPFWYKFILQNLRQGTFVANAEHISWITPSLALEIGRRAGLELEQYWLLWPYGKKWTTKLMRKAAETIFGETELFAWAFFYVYKKPKD